MASEAEGKLYSALKTQLPDGWRARHSLRLRTAGAGDSEADFVIAVPRRGLLVIEVKGGRIELSGGRWLQNGKPLDVAPRQQAQRFVRALIAALQARGDRPPPWEIACAFPDTDFSLGPVAGDVAGLVLGARDLAWLGHVLPGMVEQALAGRPPPSSDAWMDGVHALWGDTWVPRVSLADRVEDSERRAIALNDDQIGILDLAGDNSRARVDGSAGSGKTIVARELVLRQARAGKRALYLCFTDALAVAVDRGLEADPDTKARPRAASVRRYARDLLAAAGQSVSPTTHEFWDEVLLRAACEALPPEDERPDLVVVDEAQDFEPADWILIEALVQDRALWAFGDERQRYWRDRAVPEHLFATAARLNLKQQHRNPPELWDLALSYVEERPARRPNPSVLRLVVVKDPLDRVRHELDQLRKDGAQPEDIAVLTLAGRDKSRLVGAASLGSHRLALADAADAPQRVIADTFLRFKGLDRPFVIVTELIQGSTMRYETRMHIALTRATVAAVIVCDDAAVKGDPRLQALQRHGGGRARQMAASKGRRWPPCSRTPHVRS